MISTAPSRKPRFLLPKTNKVCQASLRHPRKPSRLIDTTISDNPAKCLRKCLHDKAHPLGHAEARGPPNFAADHLHFLCAETFHIFANRKQAPHIPSVPGCLAPNYGPERISRSIPFNGSPGACIVTMPIQLDTSWPRPLLFHCRPKGDLLLDLTGPLLPSHCL